MADDAMGWTEPTPFPEDGWGTELEDYLRDRYQELPDAATTARLGFAMDAPSADAVATWSRFAARNANNIGTHARFGEGRAGTRRLEKETLAVLADLYHAGATDGYITSGATEGNLCGLRIGRNAARACGARRIVILTGALAHHSVDKAAEILDLPLRKIAPDSAYAMDSQALAAALEEERAAGAAGFIVVSTAGYYGTGGVDPVAEIAEELDTFRRRHPGATLYHHVDAAHAGLFLPFTNPEIAFDFRSPTVHSMTVDPHKFGLLPYSCGVFLCRKGLLQHVSIVASRSGVVDETIIGSRPGAAAAALWRMIHQLGRRGYEKLARRCLARTDRFVAALRELDPEIRIVRHPDMNVFAFSLPPGDRRLPEALESEYRLVPAPLPLPGGGKKTALFYHCYVMPGLEEETIEVFIGKLAAWRSAAPATSSKAGAAPALDDLVKRAHQATPCLRHVVVHPPGRRDPTYYPEAYSFHEFVPRRSTHEQIGSRKLYESPAEGEVFLYAYDLERPFCNELGGIAVPGRFNLEVLDRHQAALSLVGSAFLSMHTSARAAQAIVSFLDDGSFRALELKMGDVHRTDELLIFPDQMIFKLGKDARSIHRSHDNYSFSIDISLEVRCHIRDSAGAPRVILHRRNADPHLPRKRHLHRLQLKRFPNRFFGTEIELELPIRHEHGWSMRSALGGMAVGESAICGLSEVEIRLQRGQLVVEVDPVGTPGGGYVAALPLRLGKTMARKASLMDLSAPESLDPVQVGRLGERIYRLLEPIVGRLEGDGGLRLDDGLLEWLESMPEARDYARESAPSQP